MDDLRAGRVTGDPGGRTGRRPLPARRAWWRAVVAVPTGLALALVSFSLTENLRGSSARADPVAPSCAPGASSLPGTASNREAAARRAASRWFPAEQVTMATAIAGAESSWNPTAVNKAAGGNFGLWQINSVHAGLLRGRDWRSPETNAWMAYQVWDAADGRTGDRKGSWTPWSVFDSGRYRAFLREDPGSTGTDCSTDGDPAVRVGTWNVLSSNSAARIEDGTRDLTTRTDVFGLQEMGVSSKRAAAARGADGFTMTRDRTAVPIFYRTDKYTELGQGRERAFSSGQRVERLGGKGTERSSAKFVTWVQLRDNATQQSFYVLNTHLLVGALNNAKQTRNNPRRVALYSQQLATLTALADRFQSLGSAVYVTCDCNVNFAPDARPVTTMRDHGLLPNWLTLDGEGTHGKRYIDYVWSNKDPASQVVGDRHGSDHASVAVTYLSSPWTPVNGSSRQMIYSMRSLSDPHTGRRFVVPIPLGRVGRVITKALDQVGDPWAYNGRGPDTWDSPGLTAAAWKAAGVAIDPRSAAQERTVRHVALADAEPGDIFWRQGSVSIYLGTVGTERLVVGARRSEGAVVIHTVDDKDIEAVLRPTA